VRRQAGAGIVADSVPSLEFEETVNKARAVLQPLTHQDIGPEAMPAPSVMTWKTTAQAVSGGLDTLPVYAVQASIIAARSALY